MKSDVDDIMADPERQGALDARRAAWETGFATAADRVERGEVELTDFSETIRPGVERELQTRADLADDSADADAMDVLFGLDG